MDISEPALDVARENARNLHANINFIKADALNLSLPGHFDVIVSNPPYIAMGEKKNMDSRVYAHEPASALFVPDADPLEFYRAIGRFAIDALNPQGALFFEINPLFATQLNKMLVAQGWHDVQIIRDYKGNYRFAVCRL